MSDDLNDKNGKPALALPKVMDITMAGMLKASLLSVYADGTKIELDAGAVQRVTTPCLQVLASAAKSLHETGGMLHFVNVPDDFREMTHTLGLAEVLGLSEA
jgi:chemotaxis protein CheX